MPVILAMFYHIDIATCDNKSVLLSYSTNPYNCIAILIHKIMWKVNKLAFKTKNLNLKVRIDHCYKK